MMKVLQGDAHRANGCATPAARWSRVAGALTLAALACGCGNAEEAEVRGAPAAGGEATTAPTAATPTPAEPGGSEGSATDLASRATERWLVLVDGGRYAESWDEAAAYFRGAVARDQWVAQVQGVRTPLGAVQSRALMSAQPATSLPGAPDGSYVVIQFRTAFANKASSVETITPMLDPDGSWRVSGYFIR